MRDGILRQQVRTLEPQPQPVPALAEPVPDSPETRDFPEPDGRYLTQIHVHVEAIRRLHNVLAVHCPANRDTVTSDVLVFYDRTDPKKAVAPDLTVVRDHVMKSEKSYVVWEEGRVPDLTLETLSYTTRHRDLNDKRELYASIGIQEYFVFDLEPKGENPALIRFRLNPETGMSERTESRGERLYSKVLGTDLCPDGKLLDLIDPSTDRPYRSLSGEMRLREAAELEKQAAEDRADRAEAEKQVAEVGRQAAQDRAERAEDRAERAEDRAERAEWEIQHLRQQVEQLLKKSRGRSG